MCSITTVKIIPFSICVILLAGHTLLRAQEMQITDKEPPTVLRAVAPPFIPFVFGETGVAEVVVEVRLDYQGRVTSANTVSASLFRDSSFEDTAKQWVFEKGKSKKERIAHIKFIMRIMPTETNSSELTTIYRYPAEIEIRSRVFTPPITTAPLPEKVNSKKQKSKP